jgi:hypothetical protein
MQISPESSWEDLRKNYKHLVQRCHPDRFEQDPVAKEEAEIRLRELNSAFRVLSDYHKSHHRLPFGKVATHANWQFQDTSDLDRRDEQYQEARKWAVLNIVVSKWLILGIPIGAVLLIFVLLLSQYQEGDAEVNRIEPEFMPPTPELTSTAKSSSAFKFGDTKEQVMKVQGTPTRISDDAFFYGGSRVDFQEGYVVGWYIEDGSPLRVSGTFPHATKSERLIEVGSSMEDVLAIQGEPVLKTDRRWDYGASFIEFSNGEVVGWYSSVLRPLAVAETSRSEE